MFPGATLFGVALVLIIVASLAFLLIRKPSFSFGGISAEAIQLDTKPRKSREGTKKVSEKCPNYLGYLREIPKNTRIPNECLTCTKMMECQGLDAFRREEASEKTTEMTQALRGSEKPLEQVEPQKIIEKRQVPAAPQKHLQERPSGCLNFFGYLRNMPKNTLIPDECLGCSKMVECQELNTFRQEEASEKATEMTQALRGSEKPLEQVEPQKIIEGKEVPTAPKKALQERPSGCLNFFGYLRNMPKNTLIPDECLGCSKMVECQELNTFRQEEASEKATEMTQTLRGSEKPSEQVESQRIVEERQVAAAPSKHVHERPSGCRHFFGYLRNMPKNTLIPDECLGCSKIVECLYHTILE